MSGVPADFNRRPLRTEAIHPSQLLRIYSTAFPNPDALRYSILGGEAEERNSVRYRQTTQLWSQAIHLRPENVDGILYRSRFLNGHDAVAIFERGVKRVGLSWRNEGMLDTHADWPGVVADLWLALI